MNEYLQSKTVKTVKSRFAISLFIIGIGYSQLALGQGFETPVITQEYHKNSIKKSNEARLQNSTLLSLPFWDDFSQSIHSPDTLRWEDSQDVAISSTTGINSLSLNVAVFNGIDATGAAHSIVDLENGDTDILTSCTIDLSTKSTSDNIYLSFFYEKKGNGEIPNNNDGIRVEFMNQDSVWITNVWQTTGQDVVEIDRFYQILLPIDQDQFFSDKFRFRFVATGRQTGLFDTWLIDYVYLDEGRSAGDTEYPDRTFTKPLSSPFKNYYSMPIDHFLTNPTPLLDKISSQYTQLGISNSVQQHQFNAHIYFIDSDSSEYTTLEQDLTINNGNHILFNGATTAYFRADFSLDSLISTDSLSDTAIYAEFRYELLGDVWDDGSIGSIDLNINDTIRNTFILHNYYAYDDGSAERGAGVNNTESQLAYKFGIGLADSISAVDIYFPKTIQNTQVGKQVKLKIWSHDGGFPASELFAEDIVIQKVDTLNQFIRYELGESIAVTDTFYIGWEQLGPDRIFVGLDKNTESSDRIYFNIIGDWEQNNNDITGSLMIRPVFGEVQVAEPDTTIAGLDKHQFASSINIYPNPTSGVMHIEGDYDTVDILTLSGRKLALDIIKDGTHAEADLYGLRPGMYIVRLTKNNIIINKKIILNQ